MMSSHVNWKSDTATRRKGLRVLVGREVRPNDGGLDEGRGAFSNEKVP